MDGKNLHVQTKKAEEATKPARQVYVELKKQMDMRRLELSPDEEGNEGLARCCARAGG